MGIKKEGKWRWRPEKHFLANVALSRVECPSEGKDEGECPPTSLDEFGYG
jgi:hypothetical protein